MGRGALTGTDSGRFIFTISQPGIDGWAYSRPMPGIDAVEMYKKDLLDHVFINKGSRFSSININIPEEEALSNYLASRGSFPEDGITVYVDFRHDMTDVTWASSDAAKEDGLNLFSVDGFSQTQSVTRATVGVIQKFGGIPLSGVVGGVYGLVSGHQFADWGGTIDEAAGAPYLYNGISLTTAFYSYSGQYIGEDWDTSNVTDMSAMFYNAATFNQPIGSWDTSNVTNMSYMFQNAATFNQNIGKWNTSNVQYMRYMFYNAATFNQNIGSWKTPNVTSMSNMFRGAAAFNQPIGSWVTSLVTDMNFMFNGATVFNQDLTGWCVENIKTEPTDFSTNSDLEESKQPNWDECPVEGEEGEGEGEGEETREEWDGIL